MLMQSVYAIAVEDPSIISPVFKDCKKDLPTLCEDVNCASMITLKDVEAETPNVRDAPLWQAR